MQIFLKNFVKNTLQKAVRHSYYIFCNCILCYTYKVKENENIY